MSFGKSMVASVVLALAATQLNAAAYAETPEAMMAHCRDRHIRSSIPVYRTLKRSMRGNGRTELMLSTARRASMGASRPFSAASAKVAITSNSS
jgi:hypothetical protein